MIQIHTYSIKNTRMISSMRATLNSKYCMRAQLKTRNLVNGQANQQSSNGEHFSYQEGQHRAISTNQKKVNNDDKLHLPEEIKIIKTRHGKKWTTSSMEVELAKDILEVRDGLSKVVDVILLKPKT